MTTMPKPHLSVSQILQMNLGFLGLQFSFGLQQANMSPIWGYLGAEEANFAWLGSPTAHREAETAKAHRG